MSKNDDFPMTETSTNLSVDDRIVEHGGLVVDLLGHPPHVHVALGQPLRDEGTLHAGLHGGLQ